MEQSTSACLVCDVAVNGERKTRLSVEFASRSNWPEVIHLSPRAPRRIFLEFEVSNARMLLPTDEPASRVPALRPNT